MVALVVEGAVVAVGTAFVVEDVPAGLVVVAPALVVAVAPDFFVVTDDAFDVVVLRATAEVMGAPLVTVNEPLPTVPEAPDTRTE